MERTRPLAWLPDAQRWARLVSVAVVAIVATGIALHPWNNDAAGIYVAWDRGLYSVPWLDHGAYVYAPPFAQVIWPLTRLPWEAFWAIWVAAQVAALVWMVGPVWGAGLLIVPWLPLFGYLNPVEAAVANGNPQLLLAAGVVAAYRWPSAMALPILMKVTPAIGLLWFAVRREWRRLAIAVGATVAISAVSFVLAPALWGDWLHLLAAATGADTGRVEWIWLPLTLRLPMAVLLTIWGARTDRYWTVPLAVTLALPAIAFGGLAIAVGVLRR